MSYFSAVVGAAKTIKTVMSVLNYLGVFDNLELIFRYEDNSTSYIKFGETKIWGDRVDKDKDRVEIYICAEPELRRLFKHLVLNKKFTHKDLLIEFDRCLAYNKVYEIKIDKFISSRKHIVIIDNYEFPVDIMEYHYILVPFITPDPNDDGIGDMGHW